MSGPRRIRQIISSLGSITRRPTRRATPGPLMETSALTPVGVPGSLDGRRLARHPRRVAAIAFAVGLGVTWVVTLALVSGNALTPREAQARVTPPPLAASNAHEWAVDRVDRMLAQQRQRRTATVARPTSEDCSVPDQVVVTATVRLESGISPIPLGVGTIHNTCDRAVWIEIEVIGLAADGSPIGKPTRDTLTLAPRAKRRLSYSLDAPWPYSLAHKMPIASVRVALIRWGLESSHDQREIPPYPQATARP